MGRTFQALVPVVFVHEDVVCRRPVSTRLSRRIVVEVLGDSLRWFSRGARAGGAKVKLCIWAV